MTAARIRSEIRLREEFVRSRLGRKASRAELKDLTDFMHGFAAPLESCAGCGLLLRAERSSRGATSYSEDPNDPGVMQQLFPRYLQAFRNKAPGFRDLLRPHADVLELGSHLGAFLQVAEEWNWFPVGLDVGDDTVEFQKSNGLTVRQAMIEGAGFDSGRFDAVFAWNCFEQIPDPRQTLHAIRRALRRNGLLIVRVPNARFYTVAHSSTQALAWNNLLGFPYLHGYTAELVTELARASGFEYVRGFNSELVTMPFPDPAAPIAEEQKINSARIGAWSLAASAQTGVLSGPWIEMVYRKVEAAPARRMPESIDPHFLPRA